MSTVKVTVTLSSDDLAQVRTLVQEGRVANVSAFVQHAVHRSLNDVAGWASVLAEALEGTGGPLTPQEVQWADEVLAGGGERFGSDQRKDGERADHTHPDVA
jgi:Arc/MetJ-type ribon-helix-helix transcriptional regulator